MQMIPRGANIFLEPAYYVSCWLVSADQQITIRATCGETAAYLFSALPNHLGVMSSSWDIISPNGIIWFLICPPLCKLACTVASSNCQILPRVIPLIWPGMLEVALIGIALSLLSKRIIPKQIGLTAISSGWIVDLHHFTDPVVVVLWFLNRISRTTAKANDAASKLFILKLNAI